MKNICLSILLGFSTMSLLAQAALIQMGVVREQNSGKRPVEGVQIIFTSAVPTTSEQTGKFRLAFAGKKAGDLAFMTEVSKKGYELVNDKELEHVKLSSTEQFGTDIIVAKAGVIDSAKKDYYAISDKALKAGFEKQKSILRNELTKAQLSEKQYQDQYEALQKQYENQRKELDNLSEKFAKVNFDDVSALYQEALQLFKDGKIDEAIKKLEGADLNKQTEKIIKERKSIEDDKKALAERETILAKKQKEQIETIQFLAQMYVTSLDIAKAETQYDQLLLLDSTNLDILNNVSDFYRQNHYYEKALRLYPKIIEHTQAEVWQKANAYGHLGELYTMTGNLDKAMEAYIKLYQTYAHLSKNASDNTFYKRNLAVSYGKLGETHTALGNLEKALGFYEEYNRLGKELHIAYPTILSFKYGLAISYQYLGNTHTALGNLYKVLGFYEEYNRLGKELYTAYPTNVDFKNGLASSFSKLGETHRALGNLDKALGFYEERNRLGKELYAAYPTNVDLKNGCAISYAKLGETHTDLENLDEALGFYEEYNRLEKELYASYPNNVSFKNGCAISYERLGETHTALGNLDKALGFYEVCNRLEKELYASYPTNVSFKNGLAISYLKLGETHTTLGNLETALGFYEEYNRFKKELYASYPTNVSLKNGLAISYYKLGEFSRDNLKDKTKVQAYFKQAEVLWQELVRDAPQYVEFQKFLSKVQKDLKSLD